MTAAVEAAVLAITIYTGTLRSPLYCDRPGDPHRYDPAARWIAVDVARYETQGLACGDLVDVTLQDGSAFTLPAYDAGPLRGHYVQEAGALAPIVADLPAHVARDLGIDGTSARVRQIRTRPRPHGPGHRQT